MPNHVTCNLRIRGDKKELKKFFKENKSKGIELDFNKSVPMPKALAKIEAKTPATPEMEAAKKKYGFYSWYEWSIVNWSTKWNACDVIMCTEPVGNTDIIEYEFWTAWSPPENWFKKTSKKYPKLKFSMKFSDEGQMFPDGIVTARNGYMNEIDISF